MKSSKGKVRVLFLVLIVAWEESFAVLKRSAVLPPPPRHGRVKRQLRQGEEDAAETQADEGTVFVNLYWRF